MSKPLAAFSLSLCIAACSDDEDVQRVEVTDFALHECKRAPATGTLATGRESSNYDGLECIAWKFSANSSAVDLINRLEGCGFDGHESSETRWKPQLERSSANALTVRVSWDFEGPSACGQCLSDFSISAKGAAVANNDLELTIATRSCNVAACDWSEKQLTVKGAEGIRCGYLDWSPSVSWEQAYSGKQGGPADNGTCDEQLVATDIRGVTRCLKSCTSDDDCETPLTHCVDGACQLTNPL